MGQRPRNQMERVFSALPGTTTQISAAAHVHLRCVSRHLRALEAEGRAHISDYPEGKFCRGVIWSAGPRPAGAPPMPPKRPKSRRVPKENNPYQSYLNTHQEDRTIERVKASPANWCSALESA